MAVAALVAMVVAVAVVAVVVAVAVVAAVVVVAVVVLAVVAVVPLPSCGKAVSALDPTLSFNRARDLAKPTYTHGKSRCECRLRTT